MISYAQNHEDVVLARALWRAEPGLYVDIGAEHPQWGSVTKHFYGHGWRGVNVEPSTWGLECLVAERPEDVNLGVGVSDHEGVATFYEGPEDNHGASTFSAELATAYEAAGMRFTAVEGVRVTTLARLFDEYVGDRLVDFVKIDVEGYEARVVSGGDWERFRPRAVVVESTRPQSTEPTHGAWEPILLAAGYEFTLFDGLNRFYVRVEEPEHVRRALAYPACVLDDFADATHLHELAVLRARAEAAEQALASMRLAAGGSSS